MKLPLNREQQPAYYAKQSLCSVSVQRRMLRACYLLDIWRFTENYAFTFVVSPIICKN